MESVLTQDDLNESIKKWGEVAIDKLHQALDEFDIGKLDGALWRSLMVQLVKNNGSVEKVIIKFLKYGRFVDMGSGRGVTAGSLKKLGNEVFSKNRNAKGQLKKYGRKPKRWHSKTKPGEIAILRYILARDYGILTVSAFEKSISKMKIEINPL